MIAARALARRLAVVGLAAATIAAGVAPAAAHRLKLFLTTEAGEIAGYAFFVGGGRPDGVDYIVSDATGREVHRGRTDEHGAFRWRPVAAADHTVTVNAGDGHWVTGTITADRLAGPAWPTEPAAVDRTEKPASPPPESAAASAPPSVAPPRPSGIDEDALARLVEYRVDAALERRLRPLEEAYERAEGRLRFNDIMGGIGMIVGLAGAAAWASSRRRRDPEEKP
jgi:nickel transport protein